MMARSTMLSMAAWVLVAACSAGQDDAPRSGAAGAEVAAESAPPAATGAQSRSPSRGTVPMKIAATVAGKTYQASGLGECAGSAEASIYEVPATLWHAIYEGENGSPVRRLNLTVWRPKAGGEDELVAEGG